MASLPAALVLLLSLRAVLRPGTAWRWEPALLVALAGVLRATDGGGAWAWAGAGLLLGRATMLYALPRRNGGSGGRVEWSWRSAGAVPAVLLPVLLLRAGGRELEAMGLAVALLGVLALRPGRGAADLTGVGGGALLVTAGTGELLAPFCLAVAAVELLAAAPALPWRPVRHLAMACVGGRAADAPPPGAEAG